MIKSSSSIFRHCISFSLSCLLIIYSSNPLVGGPVEDVLKYTNQFRSSRKLTALEMQKSLNEIARKHSEDMAKGRRSFGHGGLKQRQAQIQKIFKSYSGMAENVAYGARNGKEAFNIWKNSRGHRANMLGSYEYIGIGTARDKRGRLYYTQIFVR